MTIFQLVHMTLSPSFLEHFRAIWKTTDPVHLTPGEEFSFLGITLELTSVGLLLHQAFLGEYKDVTPQRKRGRGQPQGNRSIITKMPSHYQT